MPRGSVITMTAKGTKSRESTSQLPYWEGDSQGEGMYLMVSKSKCSLMVTSPMECFRDREILLHDKGNILQFLYSSSFGHESRTQLLKALIFS